MNLARQLYLLLALMIAVVCLSAYNAWTISNREACVVMTVGKTK